MIRTIVHTLWSFTKYSQVCMDGYFVEAMAVPAIQGARIRCEQSSYYMYYKQLQKIDWKEF